MSAYQCRCKYICPESTCFPRVSILSSYPVAADYGRTVCHKTFAYRPHQLEDTRFKPPKKTASQKTGEFSKPKKKETWFLNVVISHWSWSEARKKKKRVTAGAEISRLVCWWRKHISFTFPNQFPFFFLTEFRRCLINCLCAFTGKFEFEIEAALLRVWKINRIPERFFFSFKLMFLPFFLIGRAQPRLHR
jgi:hypothetical protein